MTVTGVFHRRPYWDSCPYCVTCVHSPLVKTRLGGEMLCRYSCPCGHVWTTRWSIGAVEGREAA